MSPDREYVYTLHEVIVLLFCLDNKSHKAASDTYLPTNCAFPLWMCILWEMIRVNHLHQSQISKFLSNKKPFLHHTQTSEIITVLNSATRMSLKAHVIKLKFIAQLIKTKSVCGSQKSLKVEKQCMCQWTFPGPITVHAGEILLSSSWSTKLLSLKSWPLILPSPHDVCYRASL